MGTRSELLKLHQTPRHNWLARERECVCVSVCVREREREREGAFCDRNLICRCHRQSLEELEQLVTQQFSAVANKSVVIPPPVGHPQGGPYARKIFTVCVYVVCVCVLRCPSCSVLRCAGGGEQECGHPASCRPPTRRPFCPQDFHGVFVCCVV
jgi:hypothetical protein